LPVAAGGGVRVDDGEIEAALEPAPADALGIEQIADIVAGHGDLVSTGGADVPDRIGVADHRQFAGAVAGIGKCFVGRRAGRSPKPKQRASR
jgi:hypothetical protein